MNQASRRTLLLPAAFRREVLVSAVFALAFSAGAQAQTPEISIDDGSLTEGNAGTAPLNVPATRTGDLTENIGLIYRTSAGSTNPATAGTDYVSVTAGSATLPAGETSVDLPVTINGDTTAETDEEFIVELISAINAGPTPNYAAAANFSSGEFHNAVAVGDFNGDGKPDLAAASFTGYTTFVFLNTTAPGATTATFAAPSSFGIGSPAPALDVADFNGDGRPDLVVASSGNTVSVLLNTTVPGAATASFAAPSTFAADDGPRSVSAADLNGDGRPDIAVANFDSSNVSVLLNVTAPGAASPSFTTATNFTVGTGPFSVTLGDFNGDGRVDLATANVNGDNVSVRLNTSAAAAAVPSFAAASQFAVGARPYNIQTGDLNGDGRLDLVVVNIDDDTVAVLLNTAAPGAVAASFAAASYFSVGSNPNVVAVGDLNGDGRADLAVSNNYDNNTSVLLNTAAPGASEARFAPARQFAAGNFPRGVAMADFNGDGLADIATGNINSRDVSILLSTMTPAAPAASFAAASQLATGNAVSSLASGDLNRDGRPDLVAIDEDDSELLVLLNTTPTGAANAVFAAASSIGLGDVPESFAIGDINLDGRPDLVIPNPSDDSIDVRLNTTAAGASAASFASPDPFTTGNFSFPIAVAIGDLNGDGKPDLVTANNGGNEAAVLLNETIPGAGAASFSAPAVFAAGSTTYAVAIADLNGDGRLDFAIANYNGDTVSVFLNTTTPGASTASFAAATNIGVGNGPQDVALDDVNGDGRPDLVTANGNVDTVSIAFNTTAPGATTASFSTAIEFTVGETPASVALRDLNGDGKLDLAIAVAGDDDDALGGGAVVLLNTTAPGATTPSFSAASNFAAGNYPSSLAVDDFNGDGRADLATANYLSADVSVLLNRLYEVSIDTDAAEATATILDDDAIPPYVVSINRVDTNPTTAATVSFTVTFSKAVSGVDSSDFALTTTGVVGASISSVSGSDTTRTVSVGTGDGSASGTIRLDVVDDNSILSTDFSRPLADSNGAANGNFSTGQVYDYQAQFALSVSTDGTGTGTVSSTPAGISCVTAPTGCNATYTDGTTVTLTATADANADFIGWSGDCSGTADCVVTLSEATDVTATFDLKQRDLAVTLAGNGSGSVSSSPSGISCGANCAETYADGTTVTLTATASSDSNFGGWSGACTGTATCSVTMDDAQDVTATFTLKTSELTVTLAGSGSGTVTSTPAGISCGSDCTESYVDGTSVTLTAAPAADSDFAGWSGACSGTGSCSVSVDAATTVQASFTLKSFTLSVGRGGAGSGSVSSSPTGISCGGDCTESYLIGSAVALTATPSPGSVFSRWTGACSGSGNCVVSMTANATVQAVFDLPLPAVSFAVATATVAENAGTLALNVQLSLASADAVSVPVSVTGGNAGSSDFSLAAGSISFAPNQTSATLSVAISNDSAVEGTETIVLTLGSPTNAVLGSPSQLTLSILDDDSAAPVNTPPQARADTLTVDEDSGLSAIDVLANDSDADGDALSIAAITQPDHGTAQILSGPPRIAYTPDPDFNGSDSFTYSIADGRGGTATARIDIVVRPVEDGGVAQFVVADIDVDEDAGQGVIRVVRDNGAEGELRVRVRTSDGTATAGEDYEALDEVLVFADGEAGPLSITFDIIDDDIYEGDESFNVTLEPVAAAGVVVPKALSTATVTIIEDEAVPLPPVLVSGQGGGSWSLLSGVVMLLGALLRRRLLPLAALLAVVAPGFAAAQSSPASDSAAGWYAGAAIGVANSGSSGTISRRLESASYSTTQVDLDDSDSSFGLYAGRKLWRDLGLELAYDDLGTYGVDVAGSAADPAALAAAVVRELPVGGDALALRLRWQAALPAQFGVSVFAGPYYWRSERTVRSADVSLRSKDEGVGLQAGAGLSYAITPRWQLFVDGLYAKPDGEFAVRRFAAGAQWSW